MGDHRRVLFGAQHGVAAVQELQVVVVRVFAQPLERAVAPPGGAALVRRPADGAGAAAPAAVDAVVWRQFEAVGVDLADAARVRQRSAAGANQLDRAEQSAFVEHPEQASQQVLRLLRLGAPLGRHLLHRGLAAVAQPLLDPFPGVAGAALQLDALRPAESANIALLHLQVAGEPVLRERPVLPVVEDLLAAHVVERRRDALPHGLRRQPEPVRPVPNPWQRGVQPGVVDLHPAPRLETQRLPGGLRDLLQHLHPQELQALVAVAATGRLRAGHHPHLGDQRARERLALLQGVVQVPGQVADRPAAAAAEAVRHQRPQPEPACVVLHPAGLEGGVLAVVAEHEQARARRVVDHVLRQDVDVGGVAGAHRPRRFAVAAAAGAAAERVAGKAARQDAGAFPLLAHRVEADAGAGSAAAEAGAVGSVVGGAAVPAEVDGRGPAFEDAWGFAVRVAAAGFQVATVVAPVAGAGSGAMRVSAAAAGTRAVSVFAVAVLLVAADEPVDEDDPSAPERLVQWRPEDAAVARFAAAGAASVEGEVLEMGLEVVLPAGRAGQHRQTGRLQCFVLGCLGGALARRARTAPNAHRPPGRHALILPAPGLPGRFGTECAGGLAVLDLVFRRQPQPRLAGLVRERDDRAGDSAHEAVDHGPQQGPPLAAGRRGQGQPGQDLGLRDLPADGFPEFRRQFVQRPRPVKRLVQPVDDLAPCQGFVQRLGPRAGGELVACERPVRGPNRVAGSIRVVLDRLDAGGEKAGRVFRPSGCLFRPGAAAAARGRSASRRGGAHLLGCRVMPPPRLAPDLRLVVLADRLHRLLRHAEEPRCERAGRAGPLGVDDRRRGGDADRVRGPAAAERAQPANEARRLGAHRAGERVRLVEHEKVEPGAVEQLGVPLPGEQQFQLLHVRQQDARLPAGGAHRFARACFLRRKHGLAALRGLHLGEPRLVVGPRRPPRQADAGDAALVLRRLADVHPERDARARQQRAQPHQLVLGQRVHRVDDHRADARRRALVPQLQTAADDGVEEALRLTRAGAGGDQRRVAPGDGPDGPLLVPVERLDVLWNPLLQVRMQQPLGRQVRHRRARPKRPGETDERPPQQRRPPRLVERQQLPHLPVQPRIRERIGPQLVTEEALEDLLREDDGVQRHEAGKATALGLVVSPTSSVPGRIDWCLPWYVPGGHMLGDRPRQRSAMNKEPDYRGVAKVFWSGGSQAVRLPAACRFETSEVDVIKEGDRLTLLPRGKNWGAYFDSKSRGSLPARSQSPLEERDRLR